MKKKFNHSHSISGYAGSAILFDASGVNEACDDFSLISTMWAGSTDCKSYGDSDYVFSKCYTCLWSDNGAHYQYYYYVGAFRCLCDWTCDFDTDFTGTQACMPFQYWETTKKRSCIKYDSHFMEAVWGCGASKITAGVVVFATLLVMLV